MPARANRRRDLHDHLARSRWTHPELQYLRRQHPDWRTCTACGWLIDPAAGPGPLHPNCEED